MREDLHNRLQRVTRKLALVHRLRKVALATEEELIDRMSQRSNKVLLDVRSKLSRAAKQLVPALEETGQEVFSKTVAGILRIVSNSGAVDANAVQEVKVGLEQAWKQVSQASKGNTSVMHFFNALERFVNVAMLSSLLQNPRMVERAKTDQKVRDKLYSVMEQMAQVIPQVQANLQKAVSKLPQEAPPAPEAKDTSAEEAVANQLGSAEKEMQGIVEQLSKVIVKKAEELFGVASEMPEALDENIFAIYNKRKVNPQLNRDRNFYQDALHLEHSPTHIDLGEFLDTKEKKAIYMCYRSFVMAVRALGVVQHAKLKPEIVMKNPKLQELVVKAQQILVKRKDTIVQYLKVLKKPEKEQKDKERGIPRGTFSDFLENTSAA